MSDNGPAVGVNRQRSQASALASIARERWKLRPESDDPRRHSSISRRESVDPRGDSLLAFIIAALLRALRRINRKMILNAA